MAWYLYPSVLGLDLSHDGHTPVTYSQLSNWEECPTWKGFQVITCRVTVSVCCAHTRAVTVVKPEECHAVICNPEPRQVLQAILWASHHRRKPCS